MTRPTASLLPTLALSLLFACGEEPKDDTGGDASGHDTDAGTADDTDDDGGTDHPIHADGDGFPAGVDCEDADANPGATELCDGVQDDCDATWTSDAGTATFEATDGTLTDDSATLGAGTAAAAAAVTFTEEGTLTICEGTWYVDLDYEASMDFVGLDGSDLVILDNAGSGRTISGQVTDGDVSVTGLTLTNGDGVGSGLHMRELATLSVEDVVVTGNTSSSWAGAVVLWNVDVADFQDVEITDNTASALAGIHVNGPTDWTADELLISGNISAGRIGGLMGIDGGSYTITNAEISDNEAGVEGGGLFLGEVEVDMTDVLISGNTSVTTGGGVHARSAVGTWTRVDFDGDASESGGGLTVSTDTDGIVCTDCSWTDNTATSGGAISVSGGTFEIDNGTFSGNSPTSDVITSPESYATSGTAVDLTCDGSSCW
jgi:hypothetical protein